MSAANNALCCIPDRTCLLFPELTVWSFYGFVLFYGIYLTFCTIIWYYYDNTNGTFILCSPMTYAAAFQRFLARDFPGFGTASFEIDLFRKE